MAVNDTDDKGLLIMWDLPDSDVEAARRQCVKAARTEEELATFLAMLDLGGGS